MKTKYNKKYFINKFESIPDENWTTASLKEDYKCCAAGHCKVVNSEKLTIEAKRLASLLKPLFNTETTNPIDDYRIIYSVNDGSNGHLFINPLQSTTPRGRILEALKRIKD